MRDLSREELVELLNHYYKLIDQIRRRIGEIDRGG